MKIHIKMFDGNYHTAVARINELDWAEYLVQLDTIGNYTIGIFKMPADKVYVIRGNNHAFIADPHFDDPKGE
jgi:hypothetical protein